MLYDWIFNLQNDHKSLETNLTKIKESLHIHMDYTTGE